MVPKDCAAVTDGVNPTPVETTVTSLLVTSEDTPLEVTDGEGLEGVDAACELR